MLTQLKDIIGDLGFLSFEISLAAGAIFILILGLLVKHKLAYKVGFIAVLLLALLLLSFGQEEATLLGGNVQFNDLGALLKALFVFTAIWIVFYPTAENHGSEYYFLMLSMILGSALMLGANNLLVIYLVIELTSFASYSLTNFDFNKKSFEAGMKYLLFGGVSSALALYGASILYGYSGTLSLSEMDFGVIENSAFLNLGMILFIGGVLFKVSVVPFHIWVPSSYEATPTDAVAVLSVIPKIAGFVLLNRVLDALNVYDFSWLLNAVTIMGIATIAMGTLGALRQTNVKRLIAYGAVAHSGFLMAAVLIPFENGMSAFVWYAVVYALMNIAIFFVVSIFESKGIISVNQFAGLYKQEVYMGVIWVLLLIALIGLPPTSGFTIKLYLFAVMWEWYQSVGDPLVLIYLVLAVVSVVFSLFFYLKIPYQLFLKDRQNINYSQSSLSQRVIATIFTLLVLWLFFSPKILNNIAVHIKFLDW